jgi:hypothetical protein
MIAAAAACGTLGGEPDQVIAISTAAPDSLEEYDTLRPRAAALNAAGDTVPAVILWASFDSVLTVLNPTTGLTVVQHPGLTGRLQARVGNLISNPLSIRALAAADTLFPTGTTLDSVTLSDSTPPDSLSDALSVELADTVTAPTAATVGLGGRPVVFTITYATTPDSVTLVRVDTAHAAVSAATVTTSSSGIASVKVRLLGGPVPDSVVVTASAQRAVGTTVPGSPVRFVVRFQP